MHKSLLLGFLNLIRDHVSLGVCCLGAFDVKLCFGSFIDTNIVSCVTSSVVLPWSDDFVFWVIQELTPVCQPSHTSWNHEKYWEHVSWKSHRLINNPTVKVNIWIKFSVNKVWIVQGNLLQFNCNFHQLLFTSHFEYFMSNLFNDFSPWVI